MPPQWIPINKLHPARHRDAVKLRLLHHYDLKTRKTTQNTIYGHEAIFQDDQGNRIHAFCEKPLIQRFKPLLKNGQLYGIHNPIVSKNTQKLTDNQFKLSFVKDIHISDVKDETFPETVFKFENFKYLNDATDIQSRVMFDLIGLLSVDQPPTNIFGKTGSEVRVMDIILEDLEGERLSCTLWGSYVDQMLDFLKNKPLHPVVAILQFCKGTVFQEKNKASTFFYVTKLILDQDFPPILEFKHKLMARGVGVQEVLCFSASTSKSVPPTNDLKTIDEVCEKNEKGRVWVLSKIVALENYGPWCYISCKKCSKKLIPNNGNYYCEDCNLSGFVLRFRLKVRVVDDTANLALVLCYKHCIQLFGKHAEDFLKETGDDIEIPKVFNSIIDKPVLFELELKKSDSTMYEKNFVVHQIINDPNILERYTFESSNTQESVKSKPSKSITDKADLEACDGSTKSDTLKSTGIDEGSSTQDVTMKRNLITEFDGVQTQLAKKPKVSVKIEKD